MHGQPHIRFIFPNFTYLCEVLGYGSVSTVDMYPALLGMLVWGVRLWPCSTVDVYPALLGMLVWGVRLCPCSTVDVSPALLGFLLPQYNALISDQW